ncbi:MAG: hypothetical protein WA726_07600 [Acidimicrobiia bacterium]
MKFLIIAVAVVALLYGLHLLALWAQTRGWIFYTKRPPRVYTPGLFEEIFDPSIEHRVEEQASEAIRAAEEYSGQADPD